MLSTTESGVLKLLGVIVPVHVPSADHCLHGHIQVCGCWGLVYSRQPWLPSELAFLVLYNELLVLTAALDSWSLLSDIRTATPALFMNT